MSIIRSRHYIQLAPPSSLKTSAEIEGWLRAMSDSGWRVLTDFRNWPNWMPGLHKVEPTDSEPPARGTTLTLALGPKTTTCSIDHWDPPRGLNISIDHPGGEMAYGFLIEAISMDAELRISLELERSIEGIHRFGTFFFKWRLRSLGDQLLANIAARTRPTKSAQG